MLRELGQTAEPVPMTETVTQPIEAGDYGLLARLQAMATREALARGEALTFDDESDRLFGTRAPDYDAAHFEAILDDIDRLLPGEGALAGAP